MLFTRIGVRCSYLSEIFFPIILCSTQSVSGLYVLPRPCQCAEVNFTSKLQFLERLDQNLPITYHFQSQEMKPRNSFALQYSSQCLRGQDFQVICIKHDLYQWLPHETASLWLVQNFSRQKLLSNPQKKKFDIFTFTLEAVALLTSSYKIETIVDDEVSKSRCPRNKNIPEREMGEGFNSICLKWILFTGVQQAQSHSLFSTQCANIYTAPPPHTHTDLPRTWLRKWSTFLPLSAV